MKCKPNCAPNAPLSKKQTGEQLWRDTRRDPLANAGEPLRLDTGRILGRIHRQGILSGTLAGSTGELLWDTERDARRDPLAGCSGGILGGIHSGGMLGGIHWRAALAGYLAGPTGEQLWRDTGRDPLASCSGHWRDALAGYLAGSTGEPLGGILDGGRSTGEQLWRDTGRDPLASSSGGILGGIHWRAALAA